MMDPAGPCPLPKVILGNLTLVMLNFQNCPGLYDPSLEKDACGVGFIVHIDGKKTHDVLVSAQELSRRWVMVIERE